MPVITVQMRKIQTEKKMELINKLTSAAAKVTNAPASSYTVFIEEYEPDSIGIGGQTVAEKILSK